MTMRLILLFHNAGPWLTRCVTSILSQSFGDWTCHAVDDLSDDGSGDVMEELTDGDPRFTLLRNNVRHYQCGNTRRVLDDPRRRGIIINDEDLHFPEFSYTQHTRAAS